LARPIVHINAAYIHRTNMSRAVQGNSQMFPPAVQAFVLLGLFLSWNDWKTKTSAWCHCHRKLIWELTYSVDAWLRLF